MSLMSLKSWLGLLTVYVIYLLLGGYAFRAMENPKDCANKNLREKHLKSVRKKLSGFAGKKRTLCLPF